jgi:predicted alpha/beta-hydrolase family hydrolase
LTRAAVLAPGYGGTAAQPILRALGVRLASYGISVRAITFRTRGKRPSRDYVSELEDLRWACDELRAEHEKVALVGRSFGGRMCAFLAAAEPPDALAILGHPISPPGRPRLADEQALQDMRCPTLVVQGEHDELGPLAVLQRIALVNPLIDLAVIEGAGHDFGAKESEAAEQVARWLDATLR